MNPVDPMSMPPQNRAAEQGVLGALLRESVLCDGIYMTLMPEDFYFDAHQRIFTVLRELQIAGKPADAVIVFEELSKRKFAEDIGGAVYLAELLALAPTGANGEHFAEIVLEKALARRAIHRATELIRDLHDAINPVREILAKYESDIFAGNSDRTHRDEPKLSADVMREAIAELQNRDKPDGRRPISTGFDQLDNVVGGFRGGEFILIGARPSVGKTALALSLAEAAAKAGVKPLMFSIEMNAIEVSHRFFAMGSDVPLSHLTGSVSLDQHTVRQLRGVESEHRKTPIWIDDRPDHSPASIAAVARRAVKKHGIGLIIIDYLQLIEHEGLRQDNQATRVGNTSRKLKLLARRLDVPLICLAQLNRECENRGDGRPHLSDFRESGNLEQDADVAFLLWPKSTDETPNLSPELQVIRVCVDKQRNGPKSIVELDYRRAHTRFEQGGIPIM